MYLSQGHNAITAANQLTYSGKGAHSGIIARSRRTSRSDPNAAGGKRKCRVKIRTGPLDASGNMEEARPAVCVRRTYPLSPEVDNSSAIVSPLVKI